MQLCTADSGKLFTVTVKPSVSIKINKSVGNGKMLAVADFSRHFLTAVAKKNICKFVTTKILFMCNYYRAWLSILFISLKYNSDLYIVFTA